MTNINSLKAGRGWIFPQKSKTSEKDAKFADMIKNSKFTINIIFLMLLSTNMIGTICYWSVADAIRRFMRGVNGKLNPNSNARGTIHDGQVLFSCHATPT
jgi:hypothetical protein